MRLGKEGDFAMFGKLLLWLINHANEVPEEFAVCEFDCRKTECLTGDWSQCERRLRGMPRHGENKESEQLASQEKQPRSQI
jgi:hypothetical protein